jgi:hypothetical protein
MTNEELRARLWEVERELAAALRAAELQYQRRFKEFKTLAKLFTDDEGKVQWDFLEQALVNDGRVTMIPCPPRSWPKQPSAGGGE